MTAQHFRFKGTSQALKAEIGAGALGDVYHARCWMLRRYLLPVPAGLCPQGAFAAAAPASTSASTSSTSASGSWATRGRRP